MMIDVVWTTMRLQPQLGQPQLGQPQLGLSRHECFCDAISKLRVLNSRSHAQLSPFSWSRDLSSSHFTKDGAS
jgi:hypothetical protein